MGVLFYIMDMSCGAASLTLDSIGHPLCKTAIYDAVQAAGQKVRGLRRDALQLPAGKRKVVALGADLTGVMCKGKPLSLGVMVDAQDGVVVTVDILDNGEAETLKEWVEQVGEVVGAEVLVTDDADGFKTAADENGMAHQVCKAHVMRNTTDWVDKMKPPLAKDADGSLKAIGVLRVIAERRLGTESEQMLEEIHQRCIAPPPKRCGNEKMETTLAYCLRLFSMDRWNFWPRLIFYRTWQDEHGA